ncbi:indolepyruvate ferredoxin oxidoreductase subunit alpha [Chloroflexota bacterium]
MMTKSGAKGKVKINQELCKGCELCISFCPMASIQLSDKINESGYPVAAFNDDSGCTGCAICALVCPEVAIEVYRD